MTNDIVFLEENMNTIFGEGKPLLDKHYQEIAHYQDIKLKPDEVAYFQQELGGYLKVYTARKNGRLIGYSIFFLKRNMHYMGSIQAVQDVIFVDPEHRGFGMKFIKWCDEKLKKAGVQAVYHHVKAKHDFGPGLKRMGYELIDLIYGKRLDKEI